MKAKTIIALIVILIIIGAGAYYYVTRHSSPPAPTAPGATDAAPATTTEPLGGQAAATPGNPAEATIGTSVNGNPIEAYHYGTGSNEILFIGDIHGGYTPGAALLAQQAVDYFASTPDAIPSNVSVTIIPVLNPDGLASTVGTTTGTFTQAAIPASVATQIAGRFNANKVDLNRNFDCDWQPTAKWNGMTVSGGSAAFSEPESQAVQGYIESHKPAAVVVWYAAAGGVYASSCGSAPLAQTLALTKAYAAAAHYTEHEAYTSNPIPGDLTNWLAKIGTPAISVLLTSRTASDFANNLAGIKAVLAQYGE